MPYARATGELEIEVPVRSSRPTRQRQGNLLTYPLAYGEKLDVQVTFREWQWVSMVSVVLVAIFLGYLALSGIKHLTRKGKARPA
jgi:hypothetical protein